MNVVLAWRQVERLGFARVAIMDALKGRHQNKAAVAYYLILDSRRCATGSGTYLRAELSEACEAMLQNPLGALLPSGGACMDNLRQGGQHGLCGGQSQLHIVQSAS